MKTIGPHRVTADEVRRVFANMWVRIAAWDEVRAHDFTGRFIEGLREYGTCHTRQEVASTHYAASFAAKIRLLRDSDRLYKKLATGRWRELP